MWTRRLKSTTGMDGEGFAKALAVAFRDKTVISEFNEHMCKDLREEVTALRECVNILRKDIHEKDKKICTLECKITNLEGEVDSLEQTVKRNTLRFTGVPEVQYEDPCEALLRVINEDMEVYPAIIPADIDRVHRLGKIRRQEERPRDILVTFSTYQVRNRVYKARTGLKDPGEERHHDLVTRKNIFVNEDLTKLRGKLLYQARVMKRNKSIKDCWSYDGNVVIKTNANRIVPIAKLSDLTQVAQFNQSLQETTQVVSEDAAPEAVPDSVMSVPMAPTSAVSPQMMPPARGQFYAAFQPRVSSPWRVPQMGPSPKLRSACPQPQRTPRRPSHLVTPPLVTPTPPATSTLTNTTGTTQTTTAPGANTEQDPETEA